MDLAENALDFHDRNCVGCSERQPVRLPNLTELVRQRDDEAAQNESARRVHEAAERAAIERRTATRAALHQGAAHHVGGVLDLLDALDRTQSEDAGRALAESVRAVPDAFGANVRQQIIAVADAGGEVRTNAALSALEAAGGDAQMLAEVALRALARGDAIERAGRVVAGNIAGAFTAGLDVATLLAGAAAQNLVWLARPVSERFYREGRQSEPAGLITSRQVAADVIDVAIRTALRHREKEQRRAGAYAVRALIHAGDRGAGLRFVNDLIAAFSLPDDGYEDGEASLTVARVLAESLTGQLEEIDRVLVATAEHGGADERRGVLRSYVAVFDERDEANRRAAHKPRDAATEVERVAFARILGVVSRLPTDNELLREACDFFRDTSPVPWDVMCGAAPALLGTVALAADELTGQGRKSRLEHPQPEALQELEIASRHTLLNNAINFAMNSVMRVAATHPDTLVRDETIAAVLETLEALPDRAEVLRARIISRLGALGARPVAVALVLPWVYRSLTDPSQQIRAAGATSYGRLVAEAGPDSLPSLVHETFLVLITDPFVVVHRAALRVLKEGYLPEAFLDDARARVMHVIVAHADGEHSEVLALALGVWLDLLRATNRNTPAKQTAVVKLLRKLNPSDAVEFIRRGRGGIREATGYGECVIDLLEHPETYNASYGELIEELGVLPNVEVARLAGRIVEAGMTISSVEPWRSGQCLQVLIDAQAWEAATELANRRAEACGTTRDLYPRRLQAQLDAAMIETESAAAKGLVDQVVAHAQRARELLRQIARDAEENRDIRGIFPPVRRSPAGD